MLVCVDDIILIGTPGALFTYLLTNLSWKFAMNDLDPLYYFLDIEATFSPYSLHLTQSKIFIMFLLVVHA